MRLPETLALMLVALAIALVLGVFLGTIMANFAGSALDRIISTVALCFYSIPGFWIGLMLVVLFSVKLDWLPSGGLATPGSSATGFAALADEARHMVLPATSLALFFVAIYARLTRAAVLEGAIERLEKAGIADRGGRLRKDSHALADAHAMLGLLAP